MAAEDDKNSNFYSILGLNKDCTAAELRIAYKKLALKWHPDRCAASGNSKYVEEAKKKFQAIQQAYSVLSDANKRFLYDVGVYDCNDHEDETGMGDFLNEMAAMMSQNNSNENGQESFEELQEMFEEMIQSDIEMLSSSCSTTSPACSSSSYASCSGTSNASNKRNSSEMSSNNLKKGGTQFEGFCVGVERRETPDGRKQEEEEYPQGPELVVGGMAGSKRFHLATMSRPMSISIFLHREDNAALLKSKLITSSQLTS